MSIQKVALYARENGFSIEINTESDYPVTFSNRISSLAY